MSQITKATLAAMAGYGIYGFSFLFSKVGVDLASPFVLLSVRFCVAFLVLNLLLLTRQIHVSLKGKPIGSLLLMGLFQPVIYFICETYGIAMTSTSLSGIVIGLAPVVGLIFGVLFLKERCSVFQVCCTALSVLGAALTTTGGLGNSSVVGFLFLLGALLSGSSFAILGRRISEDFTPMERTYIMSALGCISFTCIALIQNIGHPEAWLVPLSSPGFWSSIAYLGIVSSIGAFQLVNYALGYLSAGRTLIFANFTTVISVLSGIIIMGDSFTTLQLVGVCLIVLGVFGVSTQKSPAQSE